MRFDLANVLIAVFGALVWHAIVVSRLSLTMGRYRGPWGKVVNPIAWHPLLLAALPVIVIAALLLAFPLSEPLLPFQLVLAAMLSGVHAYLVWKAVKSVDRFSD